MALRQIQIDNLDKVPPSPAQPDRAPWVEAHTLIDWRTAGVLAAFVLLLLLISYYLFGRAIIGWVQYGDGYAYVQWTLILVLLYASVMALRRVLLIEQRGYKVFVWNANAPHVIEQLIKVDSAYARRFLPNAAQVTLAQAPQLEAPADDDPVEEGVILVPDSEWLPWLTELPHTMIAGATQSGKTTLARVELYERLTMGYAGIVCDPKGKEWYGLPVMGGGRQFEQILCTLDQLHAEMASRFQAYAAGERVFQPIKVIVDEVPDIMDSCLDMRRKLVDGRWSRFARQLGSLAREIGISVTLMTQSPLVEDIGMNSAMRKNFTRLALGDEAPRLIREERDSTRRAQLQELLRGQTHPAALMRRGSVHLLDTSNVVRLSQRHIAQPLGWQVSAPQIHAPQTARAAVSASVRPSETVSTHIELQSLLSTPVTPGRTSDGQRTHIYLKAMAASGKTREYARDRMVKLGMPFENKLWTEVRKDLGLD